MNRKAPEIFQRPLADLTDTPDEAGSADEVLQRVMLDYAARGFTAAVTIEDGVVRGIAVPERGIEPKEYLIGLLQQGFLEDALPSLEIFSRMVDDEDIEYNLGLCLSEMGKVAESVEPLKRCLAIDPDYQDARTALGVSYSRLGQREAAEKTFVKSSNASRPILMPTATLGRCCRAADGRKKRCPCSGRPSSPCPKIWAPTWDWPIAWSRSAGRTCPKQKRSIAPCSTSTPTTRWPSRSRPA